MGWLLLYGKRDEGWQPCQRLLLESNTVPASDDRVPDACGVPSLEDAGKDGKAEWMQPIGLIYRD